MSLTRRAFLSAAPVSITSAQARRFHAGAATANITPHLGCSIAGNMRDVIGAGVHDELHVRALVLDNGNARIAIATIDSCAVPKPILDAAKRRIQTETHLPPSHVLLSATHSHSCPAATHLFQSKPDPAYTEFLTRRITDCLTLATRRMRPARVGWGIGSETRLLFNRRFHMKPGTALKNPFGTDDQVKMNPGQGNPNIVKPAGPIDPAVGLLAVTTPEGELISLLGNYALHYVGGVGPGHISADYFPVWGDALLKLAGKPNSGAVTILTNACSGNLNGVDVNAPRRAMAPYQRIGEVAAMLAAESFRILREIRYDNWVDLNASLEQIELGVRLPSSSDVTAAQNRIGGNPRDDYKAIEDIYARETLYLARDYPKSQTVALQALRIGELGIGTFPGEAFTELGLEVKKASPFRGAMLVELANGYHGYIPTVEAHQMGGYETWRAKSSYLEVQAAPKMVNSVSRQFQALARPA